MKVVDDVAKRQAEADITEAQSLMSDPRYPGFQRYFETAKKALESKLRWTLASDWSAFTSERRAAKAAIIAGQIDILEDTQTFPKRVIEENKRFLK